jgi:hypothetical protein
VEQREDEKGMEIIRDGNYFLQKNKLIQDSEGNEENRYLVSDYNKTNIDYHKEPNTATKKPRKKKSYKKSLRISWRCYQTRSTKTYRRHSRNSKTKK